MITINIRKATTSAQSEKIHTSGDIHYHTTAPRYIPDNIIIDAIRRKEQLADDGWHFYAPNKDVALIGRDLRTASGRRSKLVDQFPLSVQVPGYTYTYQECGSKGYWAWLRD